MSEHPPNREAGWRQFLDPAGAYPSEGLQLVEFQAIEVLRALDGRADEPRQGSLYHEVIPSERPQGYARTRDLIQFDYVYAPDADALDFVSFVVSGEHLEIRLPRVEWTLGYRGPFITTSAWRRHAFSRLGGLSRRSGRALTRFIAAGIAEQRSRFATCAHCGARLGPGHQMTREGVGTICHGCASRHHGIVF